MANPCVRPYLLFLPEDSGTQLSNASQADRWRQELDGDLCTPMIQVGMQDYYIFEPTHLTNGCYCVLAHCFFVQKTGDGQVKTFRLVWHLTPEVEGWLVDAHQSFEISVNQLSESLLLLQKSYLTCGIPDPSRIKGITFYKFLSLIRQYEGICMDQHIIKAWTFTDPKLGNYWHTLAARHHVYSVPIWLYCDDTSGNISKKWKKHNSFLFTLAGLKEAKAYHDVYLIGPPSTFYNKRHLPKGSPLPKAFDKWAQGVNKDE